jgi:hypothetical protein
LYKEWKNNITKGENLLQATKEKENNSKPILSKSSHLALLHFRYFSIYTTQYKANPLERIKI